VAVDEDSARAALVAIAETALARRDELARDLDAVIEASRDVATDDEHDPEGATIAYERAKVIALVRETEDRHVEVQRAMARLAAGTYRTCEGCGGEIAAARLEARPTASTCVACATRPF
jgi:RNA polymerase-binding transcription factor DksA